MSTPALRPPRFGKKQVYLPNMVLTLLRTPTAPSTFATFRVPLNINKLDLRDYLYNAYGVQVRGIRSYIQQQAVQQSKPNAKRPKQGNLFRPRSIKKMMVELDREFVWPDVPENLEPWDHDTFLEVEKAQDEYQESYSPRRKREPNMAQRESIAEQAQALLTGKESWVPPKNAYWVDEGEAVEVETDVDVRNM